MRRANDCWGRLLSAGHKSMRRQHNPRAQKFDWTGNRWRQWHDAEPDFHGPNDGYAYDAHRERNGHARSRPEYSDNLADEDVKAHYWPDKSHYQVLQVAPDARAGDIKKAYYKQAKTYHPDKNRDDPDAHAKFERVALAYAVLIDPLERCYYDESRRRSTFCEIREAARRRACRGRRWRRRACARRRRRAGGSWAAP